MKRPTCVWLAGTRWTLAWVDALDDDIAGDSNDAARLIRTATKDCTEQYIKQTVIHELLHACGFTLGGRWPKKEEDCVRMLELPILSLFTDKRNDPLVRWLRREEA